MAANLPLPSRWQAELRAAYTNLSDVLDALGLRAGDCGISPGAARDFPLRVPRGFVARMQPGDPRDPLLLQILPTARELERVPGFVADPVGDLDSVRTPGLLQKYAGRVLLVTTGACAVPPACTAKAEPQVPDASSMASSSTGWRGKGHAMADWVFWIAE